MGVPGNDKEESLFLIPRPYNGIRAKNHLFAA